MRWRSDLPFEGRSSPWGLGNRPSRAVSPGCTGPIGLMMLLFRLYPPGAIAWARSTTARIRLWANTNHKATARTLASPRTRN